MNSMYFILHRLGPPVGDPTAMYAPPLRYKREALATDRQIHPGLSTRHTSSLRLSRVEGNTRNTTHSGRRVLRSGGPNHSKPGVFIVFFERDRTSPS